MPESSEASYPQQLGAILRRRDPRALQRFLAVNARRFGDQSQVEEVEERTADELVELMHRMIVARPDLADLHRASREWLFNRGIDTFGDGGARRN